MDNARSVDVCYVNERAMRVDSGDRLSHTNAGKEGRMSYLHTLNDDDNMVMMVMAQ